MPQVESSGPAWVSALGVLALKGNKKGSKVFVLLDYFHRSQLSRSEPGVTAESRLCFLSGLCSCCCRISQCR